MSPGVVILTLFLMSSLNCMPIILSVVLSALVPYFESARFTAQYVRSVGQDVSPGKCVLLSTSKSVRKANKLWDVAGDGGFWKVQLDVRDLGGHLDFTLRARAGTRSEEFAKLLLGVLQLVLYLWVFRLSWAVSWSVSACWPSCCGSVFCLFSSISVFGLLLYEWFGPLRCLLPMPLPFLIFFTLFGPGFV